MPLYEEKLISPLAIRFTQQRIRETFRDGHEVEATIGEIKVLPGVGDYDVMLEAPFPAIEIIRWAANGRKSSKGEHWFTFDNRRLYCLQRLAAKHWPKHVGAKVEVLYADAGTIRKKLDSKTLGLTVTIGHAFAAPHELVEWSWRKAVASRAANDKIEALIAADAAKTCVNDLIDFPDTAGATSSLESLVLSMCDQNNDHSKEEDKSQKQEKAQHQQVDDDAGETEATPLHQQSLTNLIGKLIELKSGEEKQSHDQGSDGTDSTRVLDHDDSMESDESKLESATAHSTSISSNAEVPPCDGEENQQPVIGAESNSPRSDHDAMIKSSNVSVSNKAEAPKPSKPCRSAEPVKPPNRGKKNSKDAFATKAGKQTRAARIAQATALQMAQCQQAQAQWLYTAQMMQWQNACAWQAAQYQAMQSALWQQDQSSLPE